MPEEIKNRPEITLDEWPLDLLEARLRNLETQIVEVSKVEIVDQKKLAEMTKFQSQLIELIAKKKGEPVDGTETNKSWGY